MDVLLGAIVCGVASARHLFGGDPRQDRTALAAAELVVLFGAITLVTGPLWARRSWGAWRVWDARVTSSLVGWMIALAHLLLRRYGGPGTEKLAAGAALFGAANVPFIYVSVNLWRTIHPTTNVVPTLPASFGIPLAELPPEERMPAAPLLIAAYSFLVLALFAYLLSVSRRLGGVQEDVRRLESAMKRLPGTN